MKVLICLFCAISLIACNGKKTVTTDADGVNDTIPKDTLIELLSIAGIPDSLLTENQLKTKTKLIFPLR